MAINKTDKAYKVLIDRQYTDASRQFFQESSVGTLNINTSDVWASTIPTSSNAATGSGISIYYDKFTLSPDNAYPTSVFYFMSGSGFTPGTTVSYYANSQYMIRDFISDKYGTKTSQFNDYTALLYDATNTQIFPTDTIDWLFDYKTGVLVIGTPANGYLLTIQILSRLLLLYQLHILRQLHIQKIMLHHFLILVQQK
jgi:hypothetical protein